MIKEAYCSFEVAKLLKEKGFNELFIHMFVNKDGVKFDCSSTRVVPKETIACPTHQMAMAWLREEKNILIYVYPVINLPVKDDNTFHWRWDGKKKIHCAPHIGDKHNYESYEEAVEAALEYTLKHLI